LAVRRTPVVRVSPRRLLVSTKRVIFFYDNYRLDAYQKNL